MNFRFFEFIWEVFSVAGYDNFDTNFEALRGATKAIPVDTRPELLPEHIKETISGLSAEQIQMLNDLADSTKSHIFLHDHNNNVVAMGL